MNSTSGINQKEVDSLIKRSNDLEGAMGAIAFAVLEMFRKGGMAENEVQAIHEKMKTYFMVPSNADCNAICKMLETRLATEKRDEDGVWYWN